MGLYEFEVIVDGDGAHGEGYVNVTVKPGDCISVCLVGKCNSLTL